MAAALVGLLSSCVKDNPITQEREILFQAVSYKASSKAPIQNTYYNWDDPDFGTFAFLTLGGSTTSYFSNLQTTNDVKAGGSGDQNKLWYNTPKAYWPLDGTLAFAAYSPFNAGKSFTVEADAANSAIRIQNFAVAPQDDLLYSLASDAQGYTYESTLTPYLPDGENAVPNAVGVPIKFRHALSLVSVQVKTNGNNVALTGLKLGGFAAQGTCITSSGAAKWSGHSGEAIVDIYSGEELLVKDAAAKKFGVSGLVIPVDSFRDEALLVSYRIAAVDVNGNPIAEGGGSVVDWPIYLKSSDTLTSLEPGKHYVLTLVLGAHEMRFSATTTDWENGKDGEFIL